MQEFASFGLAKRAALIAAIVLIGAAMLLHAMLVLCYNMPYNDLKGALSSLSDRYSGPWIDQGWSLFAPNPPSHNDHVLARARLENGTRTSWFDITDYFEGAMRRNRFTATRALSEGLAHAAPMLFQRIPQNRALGLDIVRRTSMMVLESYVGTGIVAIQVRVDHDPIKAGDRVRVRDYPWSPAPHVVEI